MNLRLVICEEGFSWGGHTQGEGWRWCTHSYLDFKISRQVIGSIYQGLSQLINFAMI